MVQQLLSPQLQYLLKYICYVAGMGALIRGTLWGTTAYSGM